MRCARRGRSRPPTAVALLVVASAVTVADNGLACAAVAGVAFCLAAFFGLGAAAMVPMKGERPLS